MHISVPFSSCCSYVRSAPARSYAYKTFFSLSSSFFTIFLCIGSSCMYFTFAWLYERASSLLVILALLCSFLSTTRRACPLFVCIILPLFIVSLLHCGFGCVNVWTVCVPLSLSPFGCAYFVALYVCIQIWLCFGTLYNTKTFSKSAELSIGRLERRAKTVFCYLNRMEIMLCVWYTAIYVGFYYFNVRVCRRCGRKKSLIIVCTVGVSYWFTTWATATLLTLTTMYCHQYYCVVRFGPAWCWRWWWSSSHYFTYLYVFIAASHCWVDT